MSENQTVVDCITKDLVIKCKFQYQLDDEYRKQRYARNIESFKQKREANPEYNELWKEKWKSNFKEKYKNDPEFREKRKQYQRDYTRRKKAEAQLAAAVTTTS